MKYTIRVEALIEFKSFVDCFDYKKGEKFDGLKYEPVQDIAKDIVMEKTVSSRSLTLPLTRLTKEFWGLTTILNFTQDETSKNTLP